MTIQQAEVPALCCVPAPEPGLLSLLDLNATRSQDYRVGQTHRMGTGD